MRVFFVVSSEESKLSTEPSVIRPASLTEEYLPVNLSVKPLALHILLRNEIRKDASFKAVVFTNTREATSRLSKLLGFLSEDKYTVEEFTYKNKKNLISFTEGNVNV